MDSPSGDATAAAAAGATDTGWISLYTVIPKTYNRIFDDN